MLAPCAITRITVQFDIFDILMKRRAVVVDKSSLSSFDPFQICGALADACASAVPRLCVRVCAVIRPHAAKAAAAPSLAHCSHRAQSIY